MIAALQVLAGVLIGYLVLCISESASHRHLLHAQPKFRRFWKRMSGLGDYIHNSWYSHHVVHHYRTFRQDYVTQFKSADEEETLKADLIRRGKKQISLNSYGLRVGNFKQWIKYLYPHLPHYVLMCYLGGLWFSLGALVPLLFYQWLAHFAHPYLHMNYQLALKNASPLMRPFLRSTYFRFLAQHHFMHHKYVECNFNLMLGGDVIWQCQRFPSAEDYAEMLALGMFVAPADSPDPELNLQTANHL